MTQNQTQIKTTQGASGSAPTPLRGREGPILIVFGNEKGGSGKSTAAIQTAIGLLYRGYRVGTIDLDARQGTMTRYLRNRYIHASTTLATLPCPLHFPIDRSTADTMAGQKAEDMSFLSMAMDELSPACDFVVIDTPGADTHLSRLAHGLADVLVTPMNDSLIDLDVLVSLDPLTGEVRAPSFYTRHVHTLIGEKHRQLGRKTDWIVMRNRLGALDNYNKRKIHDVLAGLARDYGFRVAQGFGERVIFRDLFLQGLTLLDLAHLPNAEAFTPSQQAAFNETQNLISTIAPQQYKQARMG